MTDSTATYEHYIEAARLSHARGDRAAAEQALRAAIQTAERLPEAHLAIAAALIKLGELKRAEGRDADAEDFFRQALEAGERALGPEHLSLVPALTSLGAVRVARGVPEEAEPFLTRALSVSEMHLGSDHPDLVVLLNDLSRLYLKQSAHAFAEPLLLRLYAIKRVKGEEHPEVATVLASLAAVRQAMGRHDSAEQLWRRVLDIRERTLAPNHFATATAIEHLSDTCAARGKIGEALRLRQRGLAMRELTLDAGHPSLRQARERIADLELQASEDPFGGDDAGHTSTPSEWRPAPAAPTLGIVAADLAADLGRPTFGAARPAETRAPELRVAEPRPRDTRPAEPRWSPVVPVVPVETRVIEPRVVEPRVAETRVPEPRAAEPRTAEPRIAETRTVEPRLADAYTPFVTPKPALDPALEPQYEPTGLRLVSVSSSGQSMASIIMPASSTELADEDVDYTTEERVRGPMAAFGASVVALASRRATHVTAAVASVAAILVVSAGPITQALSQTGQGARGANTPVVSAPAGQVAAGFLADSTLPAVGSPDSLGSDRASSTSLSVTDRNRAAKDAASTTSRNSRDDSEPAERPTPSMPSLPVIGDLSRSLPASLTAQLDSVVRAGTATAISVTDLGAKASFTSSDRSGTIDQASNGSRSLRPVLIGDAPRAPYPESLRGRGRERSGNAILEFMVDTTGRVDLSTVTVVQTDHDAFAAAARSVLASLRFFPAQQAGKKIRATVKMPFHFSINNNSERN
jgi:TonB family protein